MPDLPEVTQRFDADVSGYLAGVEEMIAATDRFRESVDAALVSVEALHAAIDDLPTEKVINIHFETSGMPQAAAAGAAAGGAPGTAGMAAEAAAAKEAGDAANKADADFRALSEAEDAAAAAAARDAAALSAEAAAAREAADAANEVTVPFERVRDDGSALDAVLRDMADSSPRAASGIAAAGTAVADSGNAARGAWGWWGLLNREVTLWGGLLGSSALIGSVQLWHIALDGVFESAVALGEALAALTVGIASMVPASQDIYNHLQAVHTVNSALGSSIPPLTGQFQALAQAMAPQTVEAYGGALNLVNKNGTTLATVAHEVVTGLDDWIAKLDIWHSAQAGMGGMLQNGVGFLHQFEQVVNNVGQAINNLIRSDPGTAHYLMDLVVGFSKLVEIVTSIPQPILTAALAIHSIDLWGGLAASKIMQLGTALVGFGRSLVGAGAGLIQFMNQLGMFGTVGREAVIPLNDLRTAEAGAAVESSSLAARFAALATNPFVWVAAAAVAIGYLAWQSNQASAAAKALTESIDKGVANAAPSQAIMLIANDVGTLNAKMTQTTRAATQSADAMGKNWREASAVNATLKQSSNDVDMYRNEIAKLTGEQRNLFDETGHLIGQGYSYQQSLALMDLAGVKTGDSFALMRQKVDNLITGYQNLGVQGGLLANAVSAVTFATELQSSKIQQLTQSYTTFLGVVTGGESAFVTAEQGVQGLGAAASGMGAQMTVSNGKTTLQTKATGALGSAAASTTTSIGGLSQSSLQLTNTWQQAITNGGNLINSLLTQSAAAGMGAKGYQLVSGAAKDYLQQLLPMAKGNQLATSELYALAQVAGYQGADSFQALSKWIGNTSNAGQDLQGKVTALTTASAGLTNDMNNLANAISGNLNQAMAAAIAQAHGGQTAFNNFANAAVHAHGTTDGMTSSASALARELIATTGDTNSAHRMFDTFSISLGLTKQQADWLWSQVSGTTGAIRGAGGAANSTAGNMNTLKGSMNGAAGQAANLAAQLAGIHSKTVTVGVDYVAYGAIPGGAGIQGKLISGTSGYTGATGMLVPGGYGGGDTVPAILEPGETVVPKHLTSAVAPLMKAHGVPGFAGGGIMGSDGSYGGYAGPGGGDRAVHIHLELNGNEIASALIPSLTSASGKYSVRNSGKATGIWRPV